jgi:branched-chain amino acid aminotransferase
MSMKSRYVWMNRGLVEYDKATLHFMTPALHYGVAVFEGIRSYRTQRGPGVFRLHEHAERLVNSAKIVGFRALPFTADDVSYAVRQTVAANGFDECYIRPLIYLSGGDGT